MKIESSKFVAHRGYASKYPENTLLAMEKAVEAGAVFLECDIQLTADHVPVVHHDADLKRSAGGKGLVMDMTLEELSRFSFGEPGRFPGLFPSVGVTTLADLVLLLVKSPDVTLFVEIKEESIDRFGVGLVTEKIFKTVQPVLERCVAISFAADSLREAKKAGWKRIGLVLTRWDEENKLVAESLSPEYLFCDWEDIPPAVGSLWRGGWKWALYEIADPDLAARWIGLGADMIETMDVGEMIIRGRKG